MRIPMLVCHLMKLTFHPDTREICIFLNQSLYLFFFHPGRWARTTSRSVFPIIERMPIDSFYRCGVLGTVLALTQFWLQSLLALTCYQWPFGLPVRKTRSSVGLRQIKMVLHWQYHSLRMEGRGFQRTNKERAGEKCNTNVQQRE